MPKPIRESDGLTVSVDTTQGDLFVTVNLHNQTREPYEVFIHFNSPFSPSHAFLDGLARLLSLHLRHGGHMRQAINQLRGIAGPEQVGHTSRPLYSLVDAVSWALERAEDEFADSGT